MFIRCWGARGSLPVAGSEYLKYGGSTTCIEVRSRQGDIVIIDAGTGIRQLGNHLLKEGERHYHMLFTHSHWDHIMGFPFFKPIYHENVSMEVYGCTFAQKPIREILAHTMTTPNFPVSFDDVKASLTYHDLCKLSVRIGSLDIRYIILSHPNMAVGFRFEEEGRSFVFMTDNELNYTHPGGLPYQDYVEFARGADLLIHDAEYKESEYELTRMWGHSIYTEALKLAEDAEVRSFGIFHHNVERADEDLDGMVEESRRLIRERGLSMDCFAVAEGYSVEL